MSEYAGKHGRRGYVKPEERCCERVHPWGSCSNRGKFKEKGKRYCGTHLPSKVKARRKERDRKFTEQWEAKQRRWARTDRINMAEMRLLEGVMELDPIPVGCEWLGELIEAVRKARAS